MASCPRALGDHPQGPTGAQAVSAARGPRDRQGTSHSGTRVGAATRARSAACRDAAAQGSFALRACV